MELEGLLVVAALVWGFGLVSGRTEGTPITPPMVFVALGLLVGPPGLGWVEVDMAAGPLRTLAEATLVLVLFGDAARIDLRALRRSLGIPARLLGLGLPLTIAAGAGMAKAILPELGWLEAATLGAILAPTDAALGQAVVSSPFVPNRIRQALNVESGLNDGIALPFVLVLASLASASAGESRTPEAWAELAVLQISLGPLVGAAVAALGGFAIDRSVRWGWMEGSFERLAGLALALGCYAAAELVGGNGFIAAFVGGMTLGNLARARCRWLYDFLEAEGQLLMLLVFLLFGASLVAPALGRLDPSLLVHAALSLTLVRLVPVSLSLIGSGLRPSSHLFLGWFGPRGIASILYGLLLLEEADLPHEERVFAAVVVAVLGSVLLHGVTAAPGAALYGRAMGRLERRSPEHAEVVSHPLRRKGSASS